MVGIEHVLRLELFFTGLDAVVAVKPFVFGNGLLI
jgi:hypothetical protein